MLDNKKKREIRIAAGTFREKCKVSRYGIMDLFKECESCGYKLLRYPQGECADLGFVIKKDEDTIIYTNTSIRLSREIFTLAHEIGHVILHMQEGASFVDDNTTIAGKSIDEKEQEANYFAACLLMPGDAVLRFIDLELDNSGQGEYTATDIARIMSEFNVSFEMVLNRLESLKIIDNYQKLRLDNERIENKVGNLLRSVTGNAKLNEPSELVSLPHEYIDYVIFNYNHKAVPEETLKKALDFYKLSKDDISDRLIPQVKDDEDNLEELIGGLTD